MECFLDEVRHPEVGRGLPDGVPVRLLQGVQGVRDEQRGEDGQEQDQQDGHPLDQRLETVGLQ